MRILVATVLLLICTLVRCQTYSKFSPDGMGFTVFMPGPIEHKSMRTNKAAEFTAQVEIFTSNFGDIRCVVTKCKILNQLHSKVMTEFLGEIIGGFNKTAGITKFDSFEQRALHRRLGNYVTATLGHSRIGFWASVFSNEVYVLSFVAPPESFWKVESLFMQSFTVTDRK